MSKKEKELPALHLRDPAAHQEFIAKVNRWESSKNDSGGGHVMNQCSAAASVVATKKSMLETRQKVGWLWPTSVWKKEAGNGNDPPRKLLHTIVHCGKKITGMIMKYDTKNNEGIEMSIVGQDSVLRMLQGSLPHA